VGVPRLLLKTRRIKEIIKKDIQQTKQRTGRQDKSENGLFFIFHLLSLALNLSKKTNNHLAFMI
jgi:hypothetical protein